MGEQLFNVAEYIRLSREDGDKAESDSVGNQRKLISDYIKSKDNLILQDVYIDDGFTGTNFNRPDFMRMIADIEIGKIDCVIVKDLSRFGRDYIETGRYLERYFPEHGVRFISITDNIDSYKQTYDMLMPIKNIFNEQYARDISGKVHAAMTTKQKNGEFIGAFASYGYKKSLSDKNRLVIDEYAAGIVRRIFSLYIGGAGKIRIAHILNDEGVLCPSEYKRISGDNYRNCNRLDHTFYWTYSTVHHILQNEIYIGNMVQGKTVQHMRKKANAKDKSDWIIVQNTHEAIIDQATWNKTQSLLNRRTRSLDLNSNVSIFAGYLKCGDCGRALVKKYSTLKNGEKNITYYCGTYVRSGAKYCKPHAIPYAIISEIVLDDLKTIIRSIDDMQAVIEEQKKSTLPFRPHYEEEKRRLETELKKTKGLKKAVYEDYHEGILSKEDYLSYRNDYDKKENLLEIQIEEIEKQVTEQNQSAGFLENPWIKRLLEFREVDKLDRDIVVEMIHEIKVFEAHKIKITYNFTDELQALFKTVYISNSK